LDTAGATAPPRPPGPVPSGEVLVLTRRRTRVADSIKEREFTRLFQDLYQSAYRAAYRLLADPDGADDAASEAFARAYAHWDEIADLPWRDAWVMRVTVNLALNTLARKRLPLIPPRMVESEDATATRLAMVTALAALSRRQQEAIVLHYLAGLTEAEVSTVMGVAPSTVKTHLKRGLQVLRTDLGDGSALG
jgi:RNA polymerase sigma factor (sigma-70 family)